MPFTHFVGAEPKILAPFNSPEIQARRALKVRTNTATAMPLGLKCTRVQYRKPSRNFIFSKSSRVEKAAKYHTVQNMPWPCTLGLTEVQFFLRLILYGVGTVRAAHRARTFVSINWISRITAFFNFMLRPPYFRESLYFL